MKPVIKPATKLFVIPAIIGLLIAGSTAENQLMTSILGLLIFAGSVALATLYEGWK